jgi:YD repeat-containing protein
MTTRTRRCTYHSLTSFTLKTSYPATPALDVAYGHDATASGNYGIGRLTSVQDASGTLSYHYDARGKALTVHAAGRAAEPPDGSGIIARPPEEPATVWLSPVKVQEDTSADKKRCQLISRMDL